MKKILLLLVVLLGTISFLNSCDIIHPVGNTGKHIQASSEDNKLSNGMGDAPLLTTESYQAYQDFIETNNLPNNFVYYEQIKQFGTFDHFVCLSDARSGDYSHYMYSLIDDRGTSIALYVELGNETISTSNVMAGINKTDMRVLSSKESGIYNQSGLRYSYVNGELLSISWQSKELTYTIAGDPMLNNYPVEAATPIAKLMNVQTAIELLNSKFDLEKQ